MMMQADVRRLILLWVVFALVLIPISPLQAQSTTTTVKSTTTTTTPTTTPTTDVDPGDAPQFDEAVVQRTVDDLIDAQVEALMAQMTVADKVGQLFLIHFSGNDTGFESDIALFVHAYRIGGVVMSPSYRNFTNERGVDTSEDTARLTNRLQALAYGHLLPNDEALLDGSLMDSILLEGRLGEENDEVSAFVEKLPTLADDAGDAARQPQNIPLFIAVEQLGDDLAVTALRRGFTDLPNQMTLGASWDPDQAQAVGDVVGRELSAVGVNLVLGPALDVYVQPRPDSVGKLGIHMYGGNPYWVSKLGQSYIAGIHGGSEGQVLTAARHFPGQGDVDRLPDQEIATVQGDLEELRYKALAPFSAVTGSERTESAMGDDSSITDILMSSHMRFSGVQPTGPERIPPISLSPELTTLLKDEGFEPWMESGLIMSDALGTPGIERFYETDKGEFPALQVANDAFGAGNDLLYLGHAIGNGDWEEENDNIESTIGFFQVKYGNDLAFADQVDDSLRRILRTKLRLYADMDALEEQARSLLTEASLSAGEPITAELASAAAPAIDPISLDPGVPLIPLGDLLSRREDLTIFKTKSDHRTDASALVRQIARDSLTVLYPDTTEPSGALRQPPGAGDQIVIVTESRLEYECSDCRAEVAVGPDDIENIILRLYGPAATDQITSGQLTSLTFAELTEVLDAAMVNSTDAGDDKDPAEPSPEPTLETPAAAEDEVGESDVLTDTVAGKSDEALDRTAQMEQQIADADWLIFAMLNTDAESNPNSEAVKRYLRERSEQIEDKQIVVLALQAPYFLDSTEISALTSYLGVYSKSPPFLENAVRAIFRDYTPYGAPPVSVPGTRFTSLETRLEPDPASEMPLSLSTVDGDVVPTGATVSVGETIRIEVGPIVDRNGHNVPDNTLVEFQIVDEGAELALNVDPAGTHNGIAIRDILLERSNSLDITASSGGASTVGPFSLNVTDVSDQQETEPAETIEASPSITETTPDKSSTQEQTGSDDGDSSVDESSQTSDTQSEERVDVTTLVVALITLIGTLSLLLIVQIRILPRATLVHNMLWTVIVGLAVYIAYGVGLLPGANMLHKFFGMLASAFVVFVGMVGTMLWLQLRSN